MRRCDIILDIDFTSHTLRSLSGNVLLSMIAISITKEEDIEAVVSRIIIYALSDKDLRFFFLRSAGSVMEHFSMAVYPGFKC
jgi:hypothetical protein